VNATQRLAWLTAVDPGTGLITVHATGCIDTVSGHRRFDLAAATMAAAIAECWADEIAAGDLDPTGATSRTEFADCVFATAESAPEPGSPSGVPILGPDDVGRHNLLGRDGTVHANITPGLGFDDRWILCDDVTMFDQFGPFAPVDLPVTCRNCRRRISDAHGTATLIADEAQRWDSPTAAEHSRTTRTGA
jgi:hypothetical protein